MFDSDKIFKTRVNKKSPNCEAWSVLVLLGFSGVNDFAKAAGINHETAGAILGTRASAHGKHHYKMIATNEALHTAFMERRGSLNRAARAYVCDWAKRWQRSIIKELMTSPGKTKEDADRILIRQRNRLREKVKNSVLASFGALEWRV